MTVFADRAAWRQCSERYRLNRHPSGKRCELTAQWLSVWTVAGTQPRGGKEFVVCEEQQAGQGQMAPGRGGGLQRMQYLRFCRGYRSLGVCLGPQQPKAC